MKSPLVEALRQASDAAESAQAESTAAEPATEQAPQVDDDAKAPESTDLQLMETSAGLQLEGGILPIDGGGILPIDGGGIPAADGASDPAATATHAYENAAAADAQFEESATPQTGADVTPASMATEEHAAPQLPPISEVRRHSHMPRLGLYSPLLCLALGAAASGGYLGYQHLVGWYHNTDLESLSSQIGAPMQPDAAAENDSAGFENRFELIVGPQVAPRRAAPATALSAAHGGAKTISDGAQRAAPLAVASRGFDDGAFTELNEAYAAFEQGDYVAAEAGYRRALAIAPKHPNALQGLAAILQRTGRSAESLQHYEMLLSVTPNNAAAAVALLAGRSESGGAAGESEIKHLIQRHPESAQLQFALGTLYAQDARWADARYAFDKAYRLDPGNADYLFNLAVSLEHLGQYLDARFYYESALAAADATSVLDSSVVVARIQKLELLANPEKLVR